jgi:pimeloyl-ACP methyl ester carboxylesterase
MMVGFDVDPELLVEVKAAVKSLPPAVLATRIAQLATVDVTTEFVNCRIPILYLRGTRDRLVSKRIAEQMSRLRPDMRVVSLKAPHLVLQRRPAAAARIVSEFVSSFP